MIMGKPKVVSPENKRVARYVANAFGGEPHVQEYGHETEPLTIGILYCVDRPQAGVTSYSTVRLSDNVLRGADGAEYPARVELVGACSSDVTAFANILASSAFCIMRTNRLVYPGTVMEGYVAEYVPRSPLPHLYFTAPFLWEESLRALDCDTKKVNWLLAMPISQAERQFVAVHGDESLEDLFVQEQIDIYDFYRPSVV